MLRPSLLLASLLWVAAASSSKRVLLISFDGFRYDLVNSSFTPFIAQWAQSGAWFTEGSQSQYLTFTAPNHMSIITGLYEEDHGIVSNVFYDTQANRSFDLFNMTLKPGVVNASLDGFWFGGETLWQTNQKAGGRSAIMYWPAANAELRTDPKRPSWFKPWETYGDLTTWMKDVDELVEHMLQPAGTNFFAWYVAEPDHTLHQNGFFFEGKLKKKLTELDNLFRYLIDKLKDRGLLDSTDIILTADHGHAEILDAKHVICVPEFVKGKVHVDFELADHMVYPVDGKHAQAMYENLTRAVREEALGMKVYWKKDLPDRFHYRNSTRIGEIVFEPEIGWTTSFQCTKEDLFKQYGSELSEGFHSSAHGMDPLDKEMRALLIMGGPSFVAGKKITEVPQNVDLYGLIAQLLRAKAAPNNGSMHVVEKALRGLRGVTLVPNSFHVSPVVDSLGFLVFVVPSIVIVVLFFTYAWRRTVVMEDPTWALSQENRYKPLSTSIDEAFEYSPPERRPNTRRTGGGGQAGLLGASDSEDEF